MAVILGSEQERKVYYSAANGRKPIDPQARSGKWSQWVRGCVKGYGISLSYVKVNFCLIYGGTIIPLAGKKAAKI
jgi:hypothetical protein